MDLLAPLPHVVGFGEPDSVRLANDCTKVEHTLRQQTAQNMVINSIDGPRIEIGWTYRASNTVRADPCGQHELEWGAILSTSSPNWKEKPLTIPRTPPSFFDNAVMVAK